MPTFEIYNFCWPFSLRWHRWYNLASRSWMVFSTVQYFLVEWEIIPIFARWMFYVFWVFHFLGFSEQMFSNTLNYRLLWSDFHLKLMGFKSYNVKLSKRKVPMPYKQPFLHFYCVLTNKYGDRKFKITFERKRFIFKKCWIR
jgi:hypothetical protein